MSMFPRNVFAHIGMFSRSWENNVIWSQCFSGNEVLSGFCIQHSEVSDSFIESFRRSQISMNPLEY